MQSSRLRGKIPHLQAVSAWRRAGGLSTGSTHSDDSLSPAAAASLDGSINCGGGAGSAPLPPAMTNRHKRGQGDRVGDGGGGSTEQIGAPEAPEESSGKFTALGSAVSLGGTSRLRWGDETVCAAGSAPMPAAAGEAVAAAAETKEQPAMSAASAHDSGHVVSVADVALEAQAHAQQQHSAGPPIEGHAGAPKPQSAVRWKLLAAAVEKDRQVEEAEREEVALGGGFSSARENFHQEGAAARTGEGGAERTAAAQQPAERPKRRPRRIFGLIQKLASQLPSAKSHEVRGGQSSRSSVA